MGQSIHWTAVTVFIACFFLVTYLGFIAARWKAGDLDLLHEWGLGGRRFGTVITWFLLGGDLYTAYTMIAVPALVYSVGAYGFFAIPYAVMAYPFVFMVMPRLWQVCHRNDYVTAADFVHGRFGSRWLGLLIALTGIVATMPYIALQLVGLQVVIAAMGLGSGEGPLIIAFVILAMYTYTSGLRAPAMIAFVKDVMLYIVVFAAIALIPAYLGGYQAVFQTAGKVFEAKGGARGLILQPGQMLPYASLALGSALALFMYPHSTTGILSASSADAIRRNAILLPTYTVLLGMIAMLGYMGLAAAVKPETPNAVVPALFNKVFPDWFAGFSFAAIAIGALVPAAIMSIGAANLWTRNVWKPFINPQLSARAEARVAKIVSLVVKLGALAFIIFRSTQYAIDLQLLGGIWILQTFPAVVFGLWRNRLRAEGLAFGWFVGIVAGTWMSEAAGLKPLVPFAFNGQAYSVYIGLVALSANIAVSFVASWALNAFSSRTTTPVSAHP